MFTNILFTLVGLFVAWVIFQNAVLIWANYRRIGKEQSLYKTEKKMSTFSFEIKEPLKFFGKRNDIQLKLFDANLKIMIEENIPHLDDFINNNNNISKKVEVGKLSKNNIAFDKDDNPFVIQMKVFDVNGIELELNDYIGSFFPYEQTGDCMIFNLKNKENLNKLHKIEVFSEKDIQAEVLFHSYDRY